MEIWKHSHLVPSHIMVSNYGRVKSLDRTAISIRCGKENVQLRKGKVISPWIADTGYLTFSVKINGSRDKYLLHRAIASAFCDGYEQSLTVNHKDGNKLNNNPSNLEWITREDNTKHQWEIGLVNIRGEKHPSHKINDSDLDTLRKRMKAGERKSDLAKEYGISTSLCYMIESGRKRNCKH